MELAAANAVVGDFKRAMSTGRECWLEIGRISIVGIRSSGGGGCGGEQVERACACCFVPVSAAVGNNQLGARAHLLGRNTGIL